MFKLDIEMAEEPEIKLPTSVGSQKKQESFRKTTTSALLTMPKHLTVWITTNCEISSRAGNTRPSYLPPDKSVYKSRSYSQNQTWNNGHVQNQERSMLRLYVSLCLFNFYSEYIMRNARLGGSQAGIKITKRNIHNLRQVDDITLMTELKSLLMRVKEKSKKASLKFSIKKN